jgi:hypothetical protein
MVRRRSMSVKPKGEFIVAAECIVGFLSKT